MAIMYLTHDVVNELLTINRFHHHQQQISSICIQDTGLKVSSTEGFLCGSLLSTVFVHDALFCRPVYCRQCCVGPILQLNIRISLGIIPRPYINPQTHIQFYRDFYLFCFHKQFTFAALAGSILWLLLLYVQFGSFLWNFRVVKTFRRIGKRKRPRRAGKKYCRWYRKSRRAKDFLNKYTLRKKLIMYIGI